MDTIVTENNPEPSLADAPRLLLSGLDSLYVSFYTDPVGSALDFEELAYQQALRQDDRGLELEPIRLGSRELLLRPFGGHPYKYVLTNEDWEIRLTERMQPNIYVRFSSKGLWLKGVNLLTDELRDWINSLGLVYTRPESVSRVDWAFDYLIPNTDFDADHFVSRADKDSTWRNDGKVETITFGKGDTVVRIYDKVAEIQQQSDKSWFFQLWGEERQAWRIEVQTRKERLKKGGIKTLQDLDDFGADLLREILSKHTTHRVPNGDQNRSRWPLSPLWKDLLWKIDQQPQTGLVASYDPEAELDFRLRKLAQSLYGYLKQAGALVGLKTNRGADLSLEDLIRMLPDTLKDYHYPSDWSLELKRRQAAIRAGK